MFSRNVDLRDIYKIAKLKKLLELIRDDARYEEINELIDKDLGNEFFEISAEILEDIDQLENYMIRN